MVLIRSILFLDPIAANTQVDSGDIHAITGVLKLYFRELPEPLFTDQYYQSFIQTVCKYTWLKFGVRSLNK